MARMGLRRRTRRFRRAVRRTARRIPRQVRTRRLTAGSVYKFKQLVTGGNLSQMNLNGSVGGNTNLIQLSSGPIAFSLPFIFTDLNQSSTFSALFDQYKIRCVVLRFWPAVIQTTSNNSADTVQGQTFFATCLDYDDATNPTSLAQIQSYENCQNWPVLSTRSKPLKRVIRPHVAFGMPNSANTIVTAGNRRSSWIDCAQAGIPHFGFKGWLEQGPSANCLQNWRIDATYYISFKNVR